MNSTHTIRNSAAIFMLGLVAALWIAPIVRGGETPPPTPADLQAGNKVIGNAWEFYQRLQAKPETAIPDVVVAKAKGVIIIDRWFGGAGIGGTGGDAIGMKKNAAGGFSAPAFYSLAGGSIGVQLGGGNVRTVVFLMTDKALLALHESKFLWSGTARASAGPNSAKTTTLEDLPDILLYEQSSSLDFGAAVAGSELSVDAARNRAYYGEPAISPADIFAGKVKATVAAQPLLEALDRQAAAKK